MALHVYSLTNLPKLKQPIFMIGSFESFHIGHNMLFEKAKQLQAASEYERDIVIVYFADVENMPKNNGVFLTDEMFRLQAYAGIGIEHALRLKYLAIRHIWPLDFLTQLTKNQEDFDIITGTDFKFGVNASGNSALLAQQYGQNYHAVDVMKLNNDQKVSTSFIKELVGAGDFDLVNLLSLFKYGFNCSITKISNFLELHVPEKLMPMRPGVYCANIEINEMYYYCLLLVKTDGTRNIEMIDFNWTSLDTHQCKVTVNMLLRPFYENSNQESNDDDLTRSKEYFAFLSKCQ
ncbi:FAD synthase [Mycoplasma simbae]|uniref:FAD synthase n=1 Tax=Mycoplasma simbae TaxID=36744 RepID=UPI00068BA4F7|nr:hypothetical protein [Mycoplasma simbae]